MPPARRRSIAIALVCAALPAPLAHQALAATAGTLFEAAPFVLATSVFPGSWTRRIAALAGCGCGTAVGPAALSLPAGALCWAIFGPWIALARFGAALALATVRPHDRAQADPVDPLAELSSIAVASAALAIAMRLGSGGGLTLHGLPPGIGWIVAALTGVALGVIAPCATSAVALAAMLRGSSPVAADAVLATAGLLPSLGHYAFRPRRASSGTQSCERAREGDARTALVLLALACAALALRGPSGLVHPRLLGAVAFAACAAIAVLRTAARTAAIGRGLAVPAIMLGALVLGSPVPSSPAAAATPDDLYPGEAMAFTGMTADTGGRMAIVRYAITCCRADAAAIALATDRPWSPPARWVTAFGTVERGPAGFVLRVRAWRRIAPPADPFVYR